VVEASEAVDAIEIVISDHDLSSSLNLRVPNKAFVFRRLTCPMRSSPTPLGSRLWEILSKMAMAVASLQNIAKVKSKMPMMIHLPRNVGESEVEDFNGDLPKC
jgi:hypothetical protein